MVIFLGHFCPRGNGAVRLSLCETLTGETRSDHKTGNYVLDERMCESVNTLRFIVITCEDLNVEPFADIITKAARSPQLF